MDQGHGKDVKDGLFLAPSTRPGFVFMKLIWAHHFIHLYLHIFIHAVFIENLQCNVYFTTSCKYKEECIRVPALHKTVVYGGNKKHEPAYLIWYEACFWPRYSWGVMTALEREELNYSHLNKGDVTDHGIWRTSQIRCHTESVVENE